MKGRQKRLNEVYEHLRKYYGIHTKTDFAHAIQYSRPFISSALNGNEQYLTDKLFENICEAYRNVFNLDYLLNGNGSLLDIMEEVHTNDIEEHLRKEEQYNQADELLKIKNELIESQKREITTLTQLADERLARINALEKKFDELQQKYNDLRYRANRQVEPYPEYAEREMIASEAKP